MTSGTRGSQEDGRRSAFRPRVLFLGTTYAGHAVRFANLEAHARGDARTRPTFKRITGWRENELLERIPYVPAGVKGRVRALMEAAPFATLPRPDVIWCTGAGVMAPYLWAQLGRLRRPIMLNLDATVELLEAMAPIYHRRPRRTGLAYRGARLIEQALWRTVTVFAPWSHWAAESLRRQGVPAHKIRVLPPGVDLDLWRPRPRSPRDPDAPVRVLFVGADFERKGGDLLLEVYRTRFRGRLELDIVTRADMQGQGDVRVHHAEPNTPALRALYAAADLFVLPTRAECFGIAATEAMSCALPVIMADVGGARDIVVPGETGWLIEPTAASLSAALEAAWQARAGLDGIGRRGRVRAEHCFDGRRNDAAVLDLLLEMATSTPRTGRGHPPGLLPPA
jgi:glycosyltransferase involved in cell wall biosynthesis